MNRSHPRNLPPTVRALGALGLALLACAGCQSAPAPGDVAGEQLHESPAQAVEVQVPAGRYEQAFAAAREALRAERFAIDRVDAPLGVLTSFARPGEGLARPWDPRTDSPAQDVAHRQLRLARVTFRPPGSDARAHAGDDPSLDLLAMGAGAPLVMRVDVRVERVARPNRQSSPEGVRLLGQAVDPDLVEAGLSPGYRVQVRADGHAARRIANRVQGALEQTP
jgi:hypothetical protein